MWKRGTQSFFVRGEFPKIILWIILGLIVLWILYFSGLSRIGLSPILRTASEISSTIGTEISPIKILKCGTTTLLETKKTNACILAPSGGGIEEIWKVEKNCGLVTEVRSDCGNDAAQKVNEKINRCVNEQISSCQTGKSLGYSYSEDSDPSCPSSTNECIPKYQIECSLNSPINYPRWDNYAFIDSIPTSAGNCLMKCNINWKNVKPVSVEIGGSGSVECSKCTVASN